LARQSEIKGMKELEKMIKKLGQLPQKVVTKAARKGAKIAQKSAKSDAPEEVGNLKKGIVLKGERSKIKGKKIYQVTFDRAMNTFFVKMSKDGKKRYYYPASQEYGFMNRDGSYTPGYRYLKKSIENNENKIEKEIVDELSKEIDKLK
jgi:HK97 gp10 family phage protein